MVPLTEDRSGIQRTSQSLTKKTGPVQLQQLNHHLQNSGISSYIIIYMWNWELLITTVHMAFRHDHSPFETRMSMGYGDDPRWRSWVSSPWSSGPWSLGGAAGLELWMSGEEQTIIIFTNTLWLCQNSYWKWPFIVDFPIESGDFP